MKTFQVELSEFDLDVLRGRTANESVLKALAYVDRQREWEEKLSPVLSEEEMVVWELVASIVEKQTVGYLVSSTNMYGTDIFGYRQRQYKSGRTLRNESVVCINEYKLTHEGWDKAKPLIQKALDFLQVPFESGRSGLTCLLGQFRLETIYTDPNSGEEYRMFDMGHGASGFAGSCSPVFCNVEWFHICRFPKRAELVNVEGWRVCSNCGQPRRQKTVNQ